MTEPGARPGFDQLDPLMPAGLAAWAIAPQVGIEPKHVSRVGSVRQLGPRMLAVRCVDRWGRQGYFAVDLERLHPGQLADRDITTRDLLAADAEAASLLAKPRTLTDLRGVVIVCGLVNLFRAEIWAADHRKATGERIACLSIVGPVSALERVRWLMPKAAVVARDLGDALALIPAQLAPPTEARHG